MSQSETLYERARRRLPGGVNSPVRAFGGVGGTPVFMARGEGPWLIDVDGRRYLDYIGSWGALILGHGHPAVREAVHAAVDAGLSFGAPTELEVEMAETLARLVPSLERLRMVNSGTEATMSALRLARGFTGREAVIKFEGCYHGHADSFLISAGSGALTHGVPTSPGVPAALAEHTLVAPYNDAEAVTDLMRRHGDRVAAVIVEPVAGNMGCVLPEPGFLETLRRLCDRHGALLIFDEVMTGFRVGLHGAQGRYGVTPDLTTLGKVIGGGLPVGAFGGRADIMARLAPEGPVYQAGTLSGNPVAMAAGLATLAEVQRPGFYETLEARTARLADGLRRAAGEAGVPLVVNQVGAMFGVFFTAAEAVGRFEQVQAADRARYARVFHRLLAAGVYFAPSAFEAGFVSAAHDDGAIEATVAAFAEALAGETG